MSLIPPARAHPRANPRDLFFHKVHRPQPLTLHTYHLPDYCRWASERSMALGDARRVRGVRFAGGRGRLDRPQTHGGCAASGPHAHKPTELRPISLQHRIIVMTSAI
ncbi:unnamed protein product [Colias eurytheme]|nr:unnamed protein product [Colias eurytheme]